jgi:EpsI family protein
MKTSRFWAIVLLMTGTALVLHLRGDKDQVPDSRPLREMPTTLETRVGTDIPIDQESLQILGKGDFLNRIYKKQSATNPGDAAEVGLWIAYFATQRSGQSIHSPQNCLPGAGWTFQSSGTTTFTDSAGKRYTVGEYLITNGTSTDEALYWYQLHGHSIASDYKAKIFTLIDSIRYGRTDAALVRIITPLAPGEDQLQAHNRAVGFARQLAPMLPAYVPN